jgi:hypothetical protein
MKSHAALFCFVCLAVSVTPGYPDTFQQNLDKNGGIIFTNTPSALRAATEVQQARDQAEIEYWRAREAKARSLRNRPDTEVHRMRRPASQEETAGLAEEEVAAWNYKKRMPPRGTVSGDLDSPDAKKGRGGKKKIRTRQKQKGSEAWVNKGNNRRAKVALK